MALEDELRAELSAKLSEFMNEKDCADCNEDPCECGGHLAHASQRAGGAVATRVGQPRGAQDLPHQHEHGHEDVHRSDLIVAAQVTHARAEIAVAWVCGVVRARHAAHEIGGHGQVAEEQRALNGQPNAKVVWACIVQITQCRSYTDREGREVGKHGEERVAREWLLEE